MLRWAKLLTLAALPVGADNVATGVDLVFSCWTRRVKSGIWLRRVRQSGAVSTRATTIRSPGGAARVRQACFAGSLRPCQGRGAPYLAPSGRHALAAGQAPEAVVGRPGGPGFLGRHGSSFLDRWVDAFQPAGTPMGIPGEVGQAQAGFDGSWSVFHPDPTSLASDLRQ